MGERYASGLINKQGFHVRQVIQNGSGGLTGGSVHGTAVADDDAVAVEAFGQGEERVLYLDHRFQQILLKLDSCKGRKRKGHMTNSRLQDMMQR